MVDAHNIEDLRRLAKRVLPRGLFEFVDRGTEDEVALRALRQAFEEIRFSPRVLVDVSKRSLRTDFFGTPSTMPLAVAPTGAAGLLWFDGEIAVARAAAALGIPFTLSTASIVSMERVAESAPGATLWFQLYMWPERSMSYQLIERAHRAGYKAMIVTVDTAVTPNREYNRRNGFSLPLRFNSRNVFDVACHPRWFLNVFARYLIRSGMPALENYPEELRRSLTDGPTDKRALPKNDALNWDDFRELRRRWNGPLLLKGIVNPDDAQRAADCGADGIIVSSHGGRNLDGCVPPISALPQVVDRVGHRLDVMVDSGFRRGSDVLKAVALGAKGVFVGRAPLWGVTVDGEAGATQALRILREEMDRVLGFLGCPSVTELDRRYLHALPGAVSIRPEAPLSRDAIVPDEANIPGEAAISREAITPLAVDSPAEGARERRKEPLSPVQLSL
jgi:isopentenyl diphosphate isomerase/L-lactate dehydrogenase-like FMN-dependent dehydrogenase